MFESLKLVGSGLGFYRPENSIQSRESVPERKDTALPGMAVQRVDWWLPGKEEKRVIIQ